MDTNMLPEDGSRDRHRRASDLVGHRSLIKTATTVHNNNNNTNNNNTKTGRNGPPEQ